MPGLCSVCSLKVLEIAEKGGSPVCADSPLGQDGLWEAQEWFGVALPI